MPPGRLLLGALASVVSLTVIAMLFDASAAQRALHLVPGGPAPLIAAVLAYTAAFWLRSLAWRLLLGDSVRTSRLFSILQTSLFLNHALPLKAGEVARPAILARDGVPWSRAASTTVVARLLDFAALLAIAAIGLGLAGRSTIEHGVALAFGAALVGFVSFVLWTLRRTPPTFLPRTLRDRVEELGHSLAAIRPASIARAFPLVVASWALEAGMLLAAAALLDVHVSVAVAVGATAFTVFFQVVHFTPGGIGVYETSMTSVLTLHGLPAEEALTLAVLTHGLKFGYSLTVGLAFAAGELLACLRPRGREGPRTASRFEVVSARAWNVLNEGKPFTLVFSLGVLLALTAAQGLSGGHWLRAGASVLLMAPLAAVFYRFDFPLKLRAALWVYLAAFVLAVGAIDFTAVALILAAYLTFTVIIWGTVYYHLRIGTAWTNFLRFWRLVAENPDPTSGNLQEQVPKVLLLVLAARWLAGDLSWAAIAGVEAMTVAVLIGALLLHQWFFTWVPALPQPLSLPAPALVRRSKRVIVIAIDGCRADRLREARTPFIDSLRREGTEYTNVSTVYPARTVTGFSSMLSGAPPRVHGLRSNFVPSLGVKCDTVFGALERRGMKGRIVGIAHLIDAFGEGIVRTVTAVMHNDDIDDALVARAKEVLTAEDPQLLVLQLLSVDQAGHARGSYNDEYIQRIEATDAVIRGFVAWCGERGLMEDTTLIITADHGQGIGVGGHGHMTPPEITIPCLLWGAGVDASGPADEARFITDIAATICDLLGVPQPSQSVGSSLLCREDAALPEPLVFVVPARNEAANLPSVLEAIARVAMEDKRIVVVDDGSTDGTSEAALARGAIVVRHESNRGLGAALRTGLAEARRLNARAAVYLDADLEYDAAEAPSLLAPIESGQADFVLGSRFQGRVQGMTASRRAANRAFSLLLSLACGRWVSDGQTGFRAFSRRALDVAEIIHDYNYAQVLTMDLLRKGMRMSQVPVTYQRRRRGRSFVTPRYLWRVPAGMLREMLAD